MDIKNVFRPRNRNCSLYSLRPIMGVQKKPDIIVIIESKRLQWYGHVKRMTEQKLPKLIMEWVLAERKKKG